MLGCVEASSAVGAESGWYYGGDVISIDVVSVDHCCLGVDSSYAMMHREDAC